MKQFDKWAFKRDLKESLKKVDVSNYDSFEDIFENVLDKHAPKKKKAQRANSKPYVTKAMRKAIMKRSELDLQKKIWKHLKSKKKCNRLFKKEKKSTMIT